MLRFLIVLFLWALVGLPASAQASHPPQAVVRFHEEPLFTFQARVGAFTPEARASALLERLEQVERDPFRSLPPLQVSEDGFHSLVTAGDLILFTVTDEDARLASSDRAALAHVRAEAVHSALARHSLLNRLRALGIGLLLMLGISAVAWMVYRLAALGFRRLHRWASEALVLKAGALRFQRLELLSAEQVQWGLLKALDSFRLFVFAALGYLHLSILFGLFPGTRGWASHLLDVALSPVLSLGKSMLDYLPKLFFLLVIALVSHLLLKLTRLFFDGVQSGKLRFSAFHAEWADPTHKLAKVLIPAFALVLAFPYLPGAGSEAFKGVSLFLGVLFSLGSSGAVTNLVAGVVLTYMRPFQAGDRVQIGDITGDVIERTALVTRLLTIKNVTVSLPNSVVLGSRVENFSAQAQRSGLILHTTVTIGYDVPWRKVHALLIEAATATEGLLADPAPFVLQTSLDDFYASYQINAHTNRPNATARIYAELHAHIQDLFDRAGVELTSPHYQAVRDGNLSTLPAESLPEDYRAPGFRVQVLPPEGV